MELKNIQELIKLVKKADLSELSIKEGDFSITIKNRSDELPPAHAQAAPQPAAKAADTHQETKNETTTTQKAGAEQGQENFTTFRSPMVGTFYRKPSADKEPFVKIGDSITTGDVLCIIEAMKLFNEIEFDGPAGKILKVLVNDASPVEYDQPLFLIEKN